MGITYKLVARRYVCTYENSWGRIEYLSTRIGRSVKIVFGVRAMFFFFLVGGKGWVGVTKG